MTIVFALKQSHRATEEQHAPLLRAFDMSPEPKSHLGEGRRRHSAVIAIGWSFRSPKRLIIFSLLGVVALISLVAYPVFAPYTPYPSTLQNPTLPIVTYPTPVRLHYRLQASTNVKPPILPPECPVPVIYTSDPRAADAVIVSSDTGDAQLFENSGPWQARVISGLEAGPQRPALWEHHQRKDAGNDTFEVEMTYRLASAVPQVYA